MKRLKHLLDRATVKLNTGYDLKIANNGNPVDQIVINYKDIYFEIDIDHATGDPTGDFGWSRDPLMSHVPVREHYSAIKQYHE